LDVPRTPVCPHHCDPFEYLRIATSNPAGPESLGPRSRVKTRIAAAATFLELVRRPTALCEISARSLERASYVGTPRAGHPEKARVDWREPARNAITLKNNSSVSVLTPSQRAVRGLRVQTDPAADEWKTIRPRLGGRPLARTRSHGKDAGGTANTDQPSPDTHNPSETDESHRR